MNIPAQVWHVLKKDIRAQQLTVAAHVIVLAISTTIACAYGALPPLAHAGVSYNYDLLRSFIVFVLGMLVVVSFFRTDSPLDARELWMSTPLDAAAIWVSKVLAASMTTLLLWTVAQFIAVLYTGVGFRESLPFVLSSALTAASILLTIAVLATVFQSLKSTLTALIGYVVVFAFVKASLPPPPFSPQNLDSGSIALATAITCAVKLAFLLLLYIKRWTPAIARATGAVVLTGLLIMHPLVLNRSRSQRNTTVPVPVSVPVPTTLSAVADSSGLAVRFALPLPRNSERVQLVNPTLKVTLANGRSLSTYAQFAIMGSQSGNAPMRMQLALDSRKSAYLPNAEFTPDSVLITLRYGIADSSLSVLATRGALIDFSTTFEWLQGQTGFDGVLDSPRATSALSPRASTRAANDTIAAFQISATTLGGNSDSPIQFADGSGITTGSFSMGSTSIANTGPLTPNPDPFVQKFGFAAMQPFATFDLIRAGSADTLRLRNRYPLSSQVLLPIPLTVLYHNAVLLTPDHDLRTWDRAPWRNARLLIRGWTYAGHASLHATTRVQ